MKKIYAVVLSLLWLNGLAQWNNDPTVNTLVSNTPLIYQFGPQSAPDGSGGLYVTWIEFDVLGSTAYIYAQHLSASGNRLWPAAGINISGTANIYTEPRIVPAGNDGAIIGYSALVVGQVRHYVQKISSAGQIQWNPGGVLVCPTTVAPLQSFKLIPDENNGAIVIWDDTRATNNQIRAQRIDPNGNLLWAVDGLPVSNNFADLMSFDAVADSTGGLMICYSMVTGGLNTYDIIAQHIDANGVATWGSFGLILSPVQGSQLFCALTKDSLDNVIVVWQDYRLDPVMSQLHGQRISAAGDFQWGPLGKLLVDSVGPISAFQKVVTDTSRGAIIVWLDDYIPAQTTAAHLFATRIDSMGNKIWQRTEIAAWQDVTSPVQFEVSPDYRSGAVVSWLAPVSPPANESDLFAQHIFNTGAIEYALAGKPISSAANTQALQQLITDSTGNAFFVWSDFRGGVDWDLYAARLSASSSTLPVTWINFFGNHVQNGILLKWQTGIEIDNKGFAVQRSGDGKKFSDIGFIHAMGAGGKYSFVDEHPLAGDNYYRLQQVDLDGDTEFSRVIRLSAEKDFVLKVFPNPANDQIKLTGLSANASITIYDVKGRKLKQVRNGSASIIDIDISLLPSGIFYITAIGKGKTIWQTFIKPR